jgi:ATP-binding cassette, subfamily B, multidrug efflux pump
MTAYQEDDAPQSTEQVKLVSRDVVRLLFSYLLRYRRFLFAAMALLVFIAGARLLVPYISGYVIDHFLIKKGQCFTSAFLREKSAAAPELERLCRRATALDDTMVFLLSHELSRIIPRSAGASEWTLIESPAVSGGAAEKIEECVKAGTVLRFKGNRFLFSDAALGRFSGAEMAGLRQADWLKVAWYVLLAVGLFLVQFAASYLQIIALMKLSQYAMRDLRLDLHSHCLSLELSFFDKNPVGRLVNRITNDIETLNEMFSSVAVAVFQDLFIMAAIVVVMFFTDVRLAIVVCASFPLIALITIVFRDRVRSAYRAIRTKIAHLNAFLNENITGIRITQVFGREARQFARFRAINHDVYQANIKQLMVYAVFRPLIDFFRWAAVAGVILLGAQMIVHASLSFGVVVMFLAYIANLFEPLGDLAEKFDIMQSANAAGEKILSLFRANAARDTDSKVSTEALRSRRLCGEIRFDNVWCAYTPDEWVLKNVTFSVPACGTLAIVGETGSGKSTIINLLARLYPWQKGRITIDGVDTAEIPRPVLRSSMAVVMQEMFLFSRTVRENIILGAPYDAARWEDIVRITHVDRLLARLPKGAEEMVMERGATFSAGERQLCAMARALYADPSILVFDEATSSIDSETEKLIQDALRHLIRGRTSIIIAHRLSTVRSADRIIVLDKGSIAEEGDHEMLLARRGLYYNLHKLQFETM